MNLNFGIKQYSEHSFVFIFSDIHGNLKVLRRMLT